MPVTNRTMTAFEALRLAFVDEGKLNPPFEKVPLEILQLDWEKAKNLQVDPETFDHHKAWEIICQIGFCKAAVLPLIDPAIAQIISRLMDLPVLPIASCSGHDWATMAWVTLFFRDAAFGQRFLAACEINCACAKITVSVNSYIARQVGGFGPRIPVEQCLANRLPLTISADTQSGDDCQAFWRAFSQALDLFDRKGLIVIDKSQLDSCVPDDERPKYLREIWNSLWWGGGE